MNGYTRTSPVAKVGLAVALALVLVGGIWVTGGLLTNDFVASVILTGAWMGGAGVACLVVAVRRPQLRLPVLGAYTLVALAATAWLGRAELVDQKVDEDVVVADAAPAPRRSDPRPAPRNVLLGRGRFASLEHESSGVASLIRTKSGRRVLSLTRFSTSNGPDLRVLLAAGPVADAGDVHDFVDLGPLKGNQGDQQYEVARKGLSPRYRTVVVWCRAFSVAFARARLGPSSR